MDLAWLLEILPEIFTFKMQRKNEVEESYFLWKAINLFRKNRSLYLLLGCLWQSSLKMGLVLFPVFFVRNCNSCAILPV